MKEKTKKFDLIRCTPEIKQALFVRLTQLQKTYSDVVSDAASEGINIQPSALTRYFTGVDKSNGKASLKMVPLSDGVISQEHLIWMLKRYSITLNVSIKLDEHTEIIGKKRSRSFVEFLKQNSFTDLIKQ